MTMPHKEAVGRPGGRESPAGRHGSGAVNCVTFDATAPRAVTTPTAPGWWPPCAAGSRLRPGRSALPGGRRPEGRRGRWSPPWPTPGRPRWWWSTGRPSAGSAAAALAGRSGGSDGRRGDAGCDLVVNATPVGMAGAGRAGEVGWPIDPAPRSPGPGGGRPGLPPARDAVAGRGPSPGGDGRQRARDAGPPGRAAAGGLDRPNCAGRGHVGGGRTGPKDRRRGLSTDPSSCRGAALTRRIALAPEHRGELRPCQPSTAGRGRPVSRFDLVLVVTTVILGVTGVVMIYSATRAKLALAGEDPHYYLKRQAAFLVIGLVVMVAMALFDYRRLEQISTVLYVGHRPRPCWRCWPPIGRHAQGSQRWFSLGPLQLQPSEFATLVLIIAIATYCSRRPDGLDFRDLVRMVLMAALPILLVIKQPDLGYRHRHDGHPDGDAGGGRHARPIPAAAARRRGGVVVFALNVGLLQALPDRAADQLHLAQRRQPDGHLQRDPGQGGHRPRGHLRPGAVPRRPDQPGLRARAADRLHLLGGGGAARLRRCRRSCSCLYGVVAWRVLRTAQLARDSFGRLLCSGIFALLVFSVFENVGMNMGIMPVTGIPLPFLSYGGSAMIGFFAAIGIVVSVHTRSAAVNADPDTRDRGEDRRHRSPAGRPDAGQPTPGPRR